VEWGGGEGGRENRLGGVREGGERVRGLVGTRAMIGGEGRGRGVGGGGER